MQIEVRPIQKKKWHGKEGKESFARPIKIQALVDPETSEYKVEMSEDDVEFFEQKGINYINLNYDRNKPHEFWDSAAGRVSLENNTQVFNTNNVNDRLKVCIMKGSKFVANSMQEYEKGFYPDATHVIYSEEEEVAQKATKIQLKEDATIASREASLERKIEIIMILAGKDARGKSQDFVLVEMSKLIDNDPKKVLMYLKEDKEKTKTIALIRRALTVNTIVKKGHKYMYYDALLGNSEEEVVRYLLKDENQELKITIENKIEK